MSNIIRYLNKLIKNYPFLTLVEQSHYLLHEVTQQGLGKLCTALP